MVTECDLSSIMDGSNSECVINIYSNEGCWFMSPIIFFLIKKINNLHMLKQRRRSIPGNREADQRLCFHYTDSTIPILSKSKISSL